MFDTILKELRTSKGITQAELAKQLDVTQQAVGRWEKAITSPDYETLSKIANFFDVSTDYLLGQTDCRTRFTSGLLGNADTLGKSSVYPLPEFYADPETRELMEKMQNDPKHRRIFLASKYLKPEELDRIADLMETIINARKSKEEPL